MLTRVWTYLADPQKPWRKFWAGVIAAFLAFSTFIGAIVGDKDFATWVLGIVHPPTPIVTLNCNYKQPIYDVGQSNDELADVKQLMQITDAGPQIFDPAAFQGTVDMRTLKPFLAERFVRCEAYSETDVPNFVATFLVNGKDAPTREVSLVARQDFKFDIAYVVPGSMSVVGVKPQKDLPYDLRPSNCNFILYGPDPPKGQIPLVLQSYQEAQPCPPNFGK